MDRESLSEELNLIFVDGTSYSLRHLSMPRYHSGLKELWPMGTTSLFAIGCELGFIAKRCLLECCCHCTCNEFVKAIESAAFHMGYSFVSSGNTFRCGFQFCELFR